MICCLRSPESEYLSEFYGYKSHPYDSCISLQNLNDTDLWNLSNLLTRNGSDRQVVHVLQLMWIYGWHEYGS